MYLADYHVHSSCSPDGHLTMADMARQGIARGLDEICFTDHVDTIEWGTTHLRSDCYDWEKARQQYQDAVGQYGDRIRLKLGAELGEAYLGFDCTQRQMADAPPLDFTIGSVHCYRTASGEVNDLTWITSTDPAVWYAACESYFEEMEKLIDWGRFQVLGHITLPLRWAKELRGVELDFDRYEEQLRHVMRRAIEKGLGIECNTNRGHLPLPDGKWLRLYHELGGELITLGSDAHTPEYISCAMEERQELLKDCGLRYFATYDRKKPIFHKI